MATTILLIVVSAVFSQNFILVKFLGICPFLGVSKKVNSAFSMGIAVTLVMVLATLVTWPLYFYIMVPLNIEYLEIIFFIFVIAALVQMLEKIIAKLSPALYRSMGIYLPLITTNCAILGVAELLLVNDLSGVVSGIEAGISMNLGFALLYALCAGIGFTLAMVLMGGVREKMEKLGVTVLDDRAVDLERGGAHITLAGVDDPMFRTAEADKNASLMREKLAHVLADNGQYTVLLTHRPELFGVYREAGVDLAFAGHAHGGQFRLPWGKGIVAPNQGLFPKYTQGLYHEENGDMVVSRGLGNSSIPIRLNNRPEIVAVTLKKVD